MLHTRKRLHAAPGIIILDVMTGDPDTQIVERVRDGETFLYEVLVRRHNQRLYRVARAFLHDEAEVEDVMQEAYLKAFTGLPRFQGKALFSTWLTRILINCALASLRSRARRVEVALDAAQGRAAEEDDKELALAQKQMARRIECTVDALPPNYRVVFVLRELEHMSVAETAAVLGISPSNAKVRLHRAKRLLREGLRQQMPDISLYGFLGDRCNALTKRVMEKVGVLSGRRQNRTQAVLRSGFQPEG